MSKIHNDLIHGNPVDSSDEAKATFVDAVRQRAVGTYKAGDMHSAKKLYTKAIEQCPRNADLYVNRAQVSLNLCEYDEALADAKRCLEYDPMNAKGYYRTGQVLLRQGKFAEARAAIQTFIDKGGDGKLMEKLLDDIKTEQIKADSRKASEVRVSAPPTKKTATSATVPTSSPEIIAPKATQDHNKPSQTSETKTREKEDDAEKASKFKGYKVNAQGQKTSYFHTDLPDDVREKLAAASKPKPISSPSAEPQPADTTVVSSWNENTYECKLHTPWAKEHLNERFPIEEKIDDMILQVTCPSLEGDLQTTISRGKCNVVSDLVYHCIWTLKSSSGQELAKGKVTVDDDGDGDYSFDCKTTKNLDAVDSVVKKHIVKEGGLMMESIKRECEQLKKEFRKFAGLPV